jgi:hypothetical protein
MRSMPGKGTQYQSPMILQLLKNREEQRAPEANSEQRDPRLQFFTRQPTERIDFGTVMEWVEVFLQVFWLSLLSGSFLLILVVALKLTGH